MPPTSQLGAFAAVFAAALCWSWTAAAVTPPHVQDFEAEALCIGTCQVPCPLSQSGFSNPTDDGTDWTVDAFGTNSGNTGPSIDHNPGNASGKYLYIESSTPCTPNVTAHLISPPLELAGTTTPAADFWYHMLGAGMGTLHVDILDNALNVLTLDAITPLTDNVDAWQRTPFVDLSPYISSGIVHIRIRGITGSNFTSDMAVDDFRFVEVNESDIGVTNIDAPTSACGLGIETISVTIENFGALAQTGFSVQYVADGNPAVVETYSGTLPPFSTAQHSFATTSDFSVGESHSISATTLLNGDEDGGNDGVSTSLLNGAVLSVFPSLEDFDSAGAWITGGVASSWAQGTPAKNVISGPYSGSSSWVTGGLGLGSYNSNEHSFVQTLCGYDFTSLPHPGVELAVWYETQPDWDGAALQTSVDGGQSWQTVGRATDPLNWYNHSMLQSQPGGSSHGWNGSSNGWLLARNDMTSVGTMANVLLRVVFADQLAPVDDGFAFDDVRIFDNTPRLEIRDVGPAPPLTATNPGATDVLVHAIDLEAFGTVGHFVTALTVTNTGNLPDADVSAIRLWEDDGDQLFDPNIDRLLDTQLLSARIATFDTMTNMLVVPLRSIRRVFISYDLDGSATPAATFGSAIAMDSDVQTNTPAPAVFADAPCQGPTFAVAGTAASLPFADAFGGAAGNRSFVVGPATYPTASMAGTNVGTSAATASDAAITLESSIDVMSTAVLPASDPLMAAIAFPNGVSTGAIDYRFDLSGYAAASRVLVLMLAWNNAEEDDHDEDNVFVSVDGGNSWLASLKRFDFAIPVPAGWNAEAIDLSAALAAASADYTSDMVLRIQAAGSQPLGQDGLLIDDVWLGEAQRLVVERDATEVLDGGSDDVGVADARQELSYTLRNAGHLDLTLASGSFSFASETNVERITLGPTNAVVAAGDSEVLRVNFTPIGGPFSFDVSFRSDDPQDDDSTFTMTVRGMTTPEGSGGAGGAGGSAGDGGRAAQPASPPAEEEGCSCRSAGGATPGAAMAAWWLALGLAWSCRRHGRAQRA